MTYIKKLKPHEFTFWHGKRPLLGQLDIELTERCNNNCIHCCINLPEDDADARGREMSTDFVKDVITQAADLGCLTVRFTGGEPLLRQDLAELYEFTRRLGVQVILFTNARLILPETIQQDENPKKRKRKLWNLCLKRNAYHQRMSWPG